VVPAVNGGMVKLCTLLPASKPSTRMELRPDGGQCYCGGTKTTFLLFFYQNIIFIMPKPYESIFLQFSKRIKACRKKCLFISPTLHYLLSAKIWNELRPNTIHWGVTWFRVPGGDDESPKLVLAGGRRGGQATPEVQDLDFRFRLVLDLKQGCQMVY
jgi:hypothetical protein